MRTRKDQRGVRTVPPAAPLDCRGGGKPVGRDLVITIPRPPVPPVMFPLPEAEALARVGGGDADPPYQRIMDALDPFKPPPDPWPPDYTWTL